MQFFHFNPRHVFLSFAWWILHFPLCVYRHYQKRKSLLTYHSKLKWKVLCHKKAQWWSNTSFPRILCNTISITHSGIIQHKDKHLVEFGTGWLNITMSLTLHKPKTFASLWILHYTLPVPAINNIQYLSCHGWDVTMEYKTLVWPLTQINCNWINCLKIKINDPRSPLVWLDFNEQLRTLNTVGIACGCS